MKSIKKFKKFIAPFLGIAAIVFLFSGCAAIGPTKQNTKNQDAIFKKIDKSEETQSLLNYNDQSKILRAATYAYGVNYSLNQISNKPVQVNTALQLNDRIVSIVGSPNISEVVKIQEIVNLMNSQVEKEREKGQSELDKKDQEISKLQQENARLKSEYKSQIDDILSKSEKIAKSSDEANTTLDKMNSWFGLGAVFYGFKHFISTALIGILIFGIVFLALRIFATVNPIAGAIFSIFNVIGAGFVSLFKHLTPGSINLSNLIHIDTYIEYKNTLTKIVDAIELLKNNRKIAVKDITLTEVLEELDKSMDQSEKDVVDKLTKDLNWK
jgi:hypothetical protein